MTYLRKYCSEPVYVQGTDPVLSLINEQTLRNQSLTKNLKGSPGALLIINPAA